MARTHLPAGMIKTLHERFGLDHLRPGQSEAIDAVLHGRDTLAVMPTGAGKSLCYQLPALKLAGTTVVVSPLISLMKDQAEKLSGLGLAVATLNSTLTKKEEKHALAQISAGESEFIFTTPERLSHPKFLATLKQIQINFVVIDEAHCVSQWGHDFRPAFLAIGDALAQLGRPPVLALTATATEAVARDIERELKLRDPQIFRSSILRANLRLEAALLDHADDKLPRLLAHLQAHVLPGTGCAIIYAASIRNVESIAEFLRHQRIPARAYHGKLKLAERTEVQNEFMDGSLKIVVATNAFGLGIDKPDVRSVIHFQFPGTLEAYYQEAGRAGRDGEDAHCLLLFLKRDKSIQSLFLAGKYPDSAEILAVYALLAGADADNVTLADLQAAKPVASTKLRVILSALKRMKIIRERRGVGFSLAGGTLSSDRVQKLVDEYRQKSDGDQEKLQKMISYAQSARCRWRILQEYFSESASSEDCGHCDRCQIEAERRSEADSLMAS